MISEGWDEPWKPGERDSVLDKIAESVVKRGLSVPAILALEIHRPIAFTLSQGVIVASPFLGPLLGLERLRRASRLLSEPDGVEALVRRIEDLTVAQDAPRQKMES